jgi:putative ABC transport system permease protein
MLQNYIKIAVRNLMRSKAFSLINIAGLAIGLTCFMLIGSFIADELGYDKYAAQYKHIYRVGLQLAQNGGIDDYPHVDVAVGAGMKNAFPEILASTRLTGKQTEYVRFGDAQFKEESLVYADSNFLKIFSIPLIEGNADKALVEPNSVVITKAFAQKYFGEKSALGQELIFTGDRVFKVTGVIENIPANSHFHFDGFMSMTSNRWILQAQTWSNIGMYTYLLLSEHADPAGLQAKFPSLIEKFVVPEVQNDMGVSLAEAQRNVNTWKFYLMSLEDIHLHSATKYEMEANSDIRYVYIFGALAFLILLLACINFTNLSTASSARRSREVGIRKSLGSLKNQLIYQFLMESVVLAFGAVCFALISVFILLPLFNQLTGKNINISFFLSWSSLSIIGAIGILVGLLAGIYPAFFLSSFDSIKALKSNSSSASFKKSGLRSGLVVFQFAISTALIIATLIVYQQLQYMQKINLGYNKDQVLVIGNGRVLGKDELTFKQKLDEDSRVIHTSISNDAPVFNANSYGGSEVSPKENKVHTIHTTIFHIDEDYFQTLGMKIVSGRNFSKDFPSDSSGVIINETAVRDFGWSKDDVLDKIMVRSGQIEYHVIGVVADFHYTSAKQKIAPLILLPGWNVGSLLVKVEAGDVKSFVQDLKTQWTAANASAPLEYYFLDDRYSNLYQAEEVTQQIFLVFVAIAIIIACLGLYGLSTYSAEQRIKEIGIRKVLGSSVQQILVLLSKEFLYLVLLGILVAVPVAWWAMNNWLQNFGYRIQISGWVFLLAGIVAIGIALVTVSFQAIKAAVANPVKSLRAE